MIHKKLKINLTKFLLQLEIQWFLLSLYLYINFIKRNINFVELIMFVSNKLYLLIVNI